MCGPHGREHAPTPRRTTQAPCLAAQQHRKVHESPGRRNQRNMVSNLRVLELQCVLVKVSILHHFILFCLVILMSSISHAQTSTCSLHRHWLHLTRPAASLRIPLGRNMGCLEDTRTNSMVNMRPGPLPAAVYSPASTGFASELQAGTRVVYASSPIARSYLPTWYMLSLFLFYLRSQVITL